MILKDYIKKLVRDYFILFALIVIVTTILRQFYLPNEAILLSDIYLLMACALLSVLPSFIFYSSKEITRQNLKLRRIVHFMVLEFTIIALATLLGLITNIQDAISIGLQIAVVYALFRFIIWLVDKKEADRINEKLREMKERL
jgi:Protein of unknown function (DUF3021)